MNNKKGDGTKMVRPKITNRASLKVKKLVAPADEQTKNLCKELADRRFSGNEAEAIRFSIRFTFDHLYGTEEPLAKAMEG